ncbi:hypothetical protein [Achromobacter sp. GD03932]|uniref:hypothetical protein n=1 Tax=Achromobacter sp. GD03932 TaxID=2975407 RepID=UPI00244A39CC|nr:hypothetical protein [Achromobacter sp. GD03932]MDH1299708.1 hypothetical protein [Achromobacter sp. GD03932]
MTTNHTEGPWAVSPENPKIIKPADQFGMASNVIIGSAAGHPNSGFFPTDEEAIANARLIAAAPELLEALEKRRQVDSAYVQLALSEVDPDTHERLLQQIEDAEDAAKDAARAAIAKAKGEQQ